MNPQIDVSDVVIRTDRLVLRPFKPDDLQDLYRYASVDGVGQMAGWLPHRNLEESSRVLDWFIQGKKTFAIEYRGEVIGSIGIEAYNESELPELQSQKGREIGYVLSKAYWGQGLMPEAVRGVIRWLFEEEKLDFLVCGHFVENLQSWRVQEKCGFVHYKRTPYTTQYGETKDHWISLLQR